MLPGKSNPVMEQNINTTQPVPAKEKRRVFKGQTEFVLDYSSHEALEASKRNRHFHQRMLRAYLKGATQFNFGFKYIGGKRFPEVHEVLQAWE
jgi:hypothetical protein